MTVNPTAAVTLSILGILWLVLFFLTFRPPAPGLTRLLFFLLWLGTSAILGYFVLIKVYKYNPNPLKVELARRLTADKMIYLGDFVPGLYDLDDIQRIDTDPKDEELTEEWLAFYQYDVHTDTATKEHFGPWGAAIYDDYDCRPPAVFSYELAPVSYNYLGQDRVTVQVDDIIQYNDPLSGSQDRPEVLVNGYTGNVVTDLNIFRKVGLEPSCEDAQKWYATHPGMSITNTIQYPNIGSFRGNYAVERTGNVVTVVDRSPFERSQITISREYHPLNGSYFRLNSQDLLDPVEFTLGFGPGQPDNIPTVYYPEKVVLAFYLQLGNNAQNLDRANSYLSSDAQAIYDIHTDQFGIALPRQDLARVLVWEIRYQPNVEAERLHEQREVTVTMVGVDTNGNIDTLHPCQVTWGVTGVEKAGALPYNCEWRLEWYQTNCITGK
jgi:hypothetical protein